MKHEEKPREKLNARNVGANYNSSAAKLDEKAARRIFEWLNELTG